MNFIPCSKCSFPIYDGETSCSNCDKSLDSHKLVVPGLVAILLVVCLLAGFSLLRSGKSVNTNQIKEDSITATATSASSHTTPSPMPSPTQTESHRLPDGNWFHQTAADVLYAQGGNGCLTMGIKACKGEKIDLFVVQGYWHIAWLNHDGTTSYTVLTPGQITTVEIPADAVTVYFGNAKPQQLH